MDTYTVISYIGVFIFLLYQWWNVRTVIMNAKMLLSSKTITLEEAKELIREEQKNHGIQDLIISIEVDSGNHVGCMSRNRNNYSLVFNKDYMLNGVVIHEMSHLGKGHFEMLKNPIVEFFKSIVYDFYMEPQAIFYTRRRLKELRKKERLNSKA